MTRLVHSATLQVLLLALVVTASAIYDDGYEERQRSYYNDGHGYHSSSSSWGDNKRTYHYDVYGGGEYGHSGSGNAHRAHSHHQHRYVGMICVLCRNCRPHPPLFSHLQRPGGRLLRREPILIIR